jgi:hypothetical protein
MHYAADDTAMRSSRMSRRLRRAAASRGSRALVGYEQLHAAERAQQAGVAAIPAVEREVGEEFGDALVQDGAVVATGLWPSAHASQLLPTPVGPHRLKLS